MLQDKINTVEGKLASKGITWWLGAGSECRCCDPTQAIATVVDIKAPHAVAFIPTTEISSGQEPWKSITDKWDCWLSIGEETFEVYMEEQDAGGKWVPDTTETVRLGYFIVKVSEADEAFVVETLVEEDFTVASLGGGYYEVETA